MLCCEAEAGTPVDSESEKSSPHPPGDEGGLATGSGFSEAGTAASVGMDLAVVAATTGAVGDCTLLAVSRAG